MVAAAEPEGETSNWYGAESGAERCGCQTGQRMEIPEVTQVTKNVNLDTHFRVPFWDHVGFGGCPFFDCNFARGQNGEEILKRSLD